MAAMAQQPLAELFVVDRPEAMWTGYEVVGDDSAHGRGKQRQQQPRAPMTRPGVVIDRLSNVDQGLVENGARPAIGTVSVGDSHQRGKQSLLYGLDRLPDLRAGRYR